MSKIIFFEGIDRCGKTTAMKHFNERTNYRLMCFDRGPISYYAYAKIYKREFYNWDSFLKYNSHKILIVYITAENVAIKKRIKDTNHKDFDVSLHRNVFDYYAKELINQGITVLHFDNTRMTKEHLVDEMLFMISRHL